MPRQDTMDFLTAFAVGTVLGIGATLLLRPEPTPKERVLKQLKPYRKQLRKGYKNARSATAGLTDDAVSAGGELLGDFQEELAEIMSDARDELRDMVEDQLKVARKRVKKGRKRFGV